MRRIILLIPLITISVSCHNGHEEENDINLNEISQTDLTFSEKDTLHNFSKFGDFLTNGRLIIGNDFYFDYNDNKSLSLFQFNSLTTKRMIEHNDNGPLELSTRNGIVDVLVRGNHASVRSYDLKSIFKGKTVLLDSLSIGNADHVAITDSIIFTSDPHNKNIICIYNKKGKPVASFDPFNNALQYIKDSDKQYIVGQGYLIYNEHSKLLVYATIYTGDIFIYSIKGHSWRPFKHIRLDNAPNLDDFKTFYVNKETMIYSKSGCTYASNIFLLIKNSSITDNISPYYILCIDKNGNISSNKAKINARYIRVIGDTLYTIGSKDSKAYHLYSSKINSK